MLRLQILHVWIEPQLLFLRGRLPLLQRNIERIISLPVSVIKMPPLAFEQGETVFCHHLLKLLAVFEDFR